VDQSLKQSKINSKIKNAWISKPTKIHSFFNAKNQQWIGQYYYIQTTADS